MKKIHRITTALLLSMILVIGGGERCSAVVNDNVLNSGLELKVGEPSNDGETIFSLLHQILTELAYVRNAVTSDESVSNEDLKELIIGNYSSDKLCTQPTIVEARGYNNHLTVTWTKPTTTNVAVAKYNVYICPSDTAPLDLTDFTKIGTVAYNEFENNFTYVSPELLPNVNYWVMVTSESKRGVNTDQLVLNGSNIMKCVDKSAIASNIFTITEENDTITSCYTTQAFDYILNIPEKINGKTVVGVGSPNGNNATVAAGNFRDILIPDTVTQVNSYFLNSKNTCINLGISKDNCGSFNRYDRLPDAVTDVGDYAFNAMSSLSSNSIQIPNSIVNIGAYAYSGTQVTDTKIVDGQIKNIGSYAFANCNKLDSTLYVPNMQSFGTGVFSNCGSLRNIEINYPTLNSTFNNCANIDNIVLGTNVVSVDINCFVNTNCGTRYHRRNDGGTNTGTFGNGSSCKAFANCRIGYNHNLQSYMSSVPTQLFVLNPNTLFHYSYSIYNAAEYGDNYEFGSVTVPFMPSITWQVLVPYCDYVRISWWDGQRYYASKVSEDCLYNSKSGGITKLIIYCSSGSYNTSSKQFTAGSFSDCMRAQTGPNLAWLADQFIEQHNINDVVVPSFK